jgi:mRNA-degrading endonuclease RelE of RelBE toxin-antitoxin system
MGFMDFLDKASNTIDKVAGAANAANSIYRNTKPFRKIGGRLFRGGVNAIGGLADAYRARKGDYRVYDK